LQWKHFIFFFVSGLKKSKCGGISYFFPLKIFVNFKLSFPSPISFSPFIFILFKKNLLAIFFHFVNMFLKNFHCIFFSLSLLSFNIYVWGFLATSIGR
jgi:hypothetical protein